MRKHIILGCIVIVTAIAVVWSMSTLAKPKIAGNVEATEASAPISPHEIMVRQGANLPVEYWTDPF
jgi:hypothetical protein